LTNYQAIVETSRVVDAKALAPLSLLPAADLPESSAGSDPFNPNSEAVSPK
jgi:hypothetical protein